MKALPLKHWNSALPASFLLRCITPAKSLIIAALLLVGLLFALAWETKGANFFYDIPANSIHPLGGNAHAVTLPMPPWIWIGWGKRSVLLLENQVPLAVPDSLQGDVISLGLGRYLNPRPAELYFSASDNSNPQTNGRKYTVERPAGVPLPFLGTLLVGFVFFAVLGFRPAFSARSRLMAILPYSAFLLIAVTWTFAVISPPPLVIPSGDGGNVASVVAAELHPDRFMGDPVFSRPQNYQFYQTVMIPAVAGLTFLTGDIGTSYMLMSMPLILLQLIGFYLLGRELMDGRIWPFILALGSIPPVYVFSGELWGMLASPLTRSAFAAIFPFLLLAGFRASRSWHVIPVMLACGVAIYVHPVSAPSVALGILAMLFIAKPSSTTWFRHMLWILMGGVVFLLSAIPFGLVFFTSFANPGAGKAEIAKILTQTLRSNVGDQYYDAFLAMRQFLETVLEPGLSWVSVIWILAAVAPLFLWSNGREPRVSRLAMFAVGLGLGSFGVAFVDQSFALLRGVAPYEIDLIRNVRFFIPVMLIALIWWASKASASRTSLMSALGMAVLTGWWVHFPTPFGSLFQRTFLSTSTAGSASGTDERKLIDYIATLPANSRILPLPHRSNSEGVGLIALAIRYAALQPTAYLFKDMNFLSYSGSVEIEAWQATTQALDLAENDLSPPVETLRSVVEETDTKYILVHDSASSLLTRAANTLGDDPMTFGAWTLIPMRNKGL